MATVTVTETGVRILVSMTRDGGVDTVKYNAQSITDVPVVPGRFIEGVDITSSLTAPQLAIVKQVLDFIEAKAKAAWNIP